MSKIYMIEVYEPEFDSEYLLRYAFRDSADAEEFALSLAEENAYHNFIHAMYNLDLFKTPDEYFAHMEHLKSYSRVKTLEYYLYLYTGIDYEVIEGKLL